MLTKLKLRAAALFPLLLILASLAVIVPAKTTDAAGPGIAVSPASGVAGTTVRVTGTAFISSASDLMQLYIDDIQLKSGSGTISGSNFQTTFVVPDLTAPGYHVISIRGRSGVLAENQFYIPNPEIVLDHWSGAVGTNIKAYCKGFHAGKEVSIQYYSTAVSEVVASQVASDTGECTVQFMLPVSSTGAHDVIAKNEVGDFAKAEFEVIPILSINPPSGGVGDKINIIGTGFTGSSEVGVSLHGNKMGFAQVSQRGSFSYVFTVPVLQAGTYVVEIEDSSQTKRWIDFTVDTRLTLSKSMGEVGLKLTLSGSAFEPGGMIQIKYDNDELAWVMADHDGAFTSSFNVPVSPAGGHIITVSDGFNTQYIVFSVEADAPPAPKPTTPKEDSVVSAQVVFDWESVYDPSEPVLYSLQISRTADFVQPILDKHGLALSHYELAKEDALRPSRRSTYYYWRVRATDSASNKGDWSVPIAFQVEPSNVLPVWADVALGFIGVLLVIVLIGRIRKGTKALDAEKKEDK